MKLGEVFDLLTEKGDGYSRDDVKDWAFEIAQEKVAKDLAKISKMREDGLLSSTGSKKLIRAMFKESLAWQIVAAK